MLATIGLVRDGSADIKETAESGFAMKSGHAPYRLGDRNGLPRTVLLMILTLAFGNGCTLIRSALELPDRAIQAVLRLDEEGEAVDPVELQSQLLRFADNYLDAVQPTIGRLLQTDVEPAQRRHVLQRRISMTEDVVAVATGSNTFANLLDMVILVTLNRMNVEDFWMPKRFGASAKPLLLVSRDAEKEIWRIAATALKKEQIEELREGIRVWHDQHPEGRSPRDVGALGFSSEIARMSRIDQRKAASVFNLLLIDPLVDLDPATRELANTRLFAERGLFLARHLPTLMRWQMELLAVQTAEMPQTEQLLASTSQLSQSAERFSRVSERLPTVIGTERERILAALKSEREGLTMLAAQSKEAMATGKQMSDAVDATLKTFQEVVQQLESIPSDPRSEPFRIQDYTAAAAQMNTTAQRLLELLQAFDQTISPKNLDALSARMDLLSARMQSSSQQVVDYAFRKAVVLGLILIAAGCAMVLISSLLYGVIKKKFAAIPQRKTQE